MKLFGGYLPFVGWEEINIDNTGEPSEHVTHWVGDAFILEWFHRGVIVYIANVRRRQNAR